MCLLLGLGNQGCEARSQAAPPPQVRPPAQVATAKVHDEPLVETRSFFGDVHAESDASLSAAESGRVTKVHVHIGDAVKKGQVLVELDDQLARLDLNEAVASRDKLATQKAQADLEVRQYSEMRKELVVSQLEATRKESEAMSLSAASQGESARVAQGTERLRRHRIVAPFSGTVAFRNVDPGDWLDAGQVALQLLTVSHVEVEVRIPAQMLDSLGQVTSVRVLGREGRSVPGRIESSVNALDPHTRTALLRVLIDGESPDWLRVGAGVDVEFAVSREDGRTIPRDAIVYGVAAPRVFRVQEGKAEAIDIEILATSGHKALVKSADLRSSDRLVVKGNERLRPGQPVDESQALVPAPKE